MAETPRSIRAFAAVELDASIRDAVAALVGRFRALPLRISWVRPENLHLTLRFLGTIEAEHLDTYAALLSEDLACVVPFVARVRGVGAFPNAQRPSVLWTALDAQLPALGDLHAIAERAARSIGLCPEERPFVPHVTLGRLRREVAAIDLAPRLDAETSFDAGAFTVEAVSLFSSELTPHGARYTRLHRLTLDGLPRTRDL